MKKIKDPIHDYIQIDDHFVDDVVDTAHFQRLREIKQLDTTRWVYPSANHSRFEHSLGVFHLGSRAFESLRDDKNFTDGVSENELNDIERTLKYACLFHDIGHFPFSHLGEDYVNEEPLIEKLESHGLKSELSSAGVRLEDDAGKHEMMSCLTIMEKYDDTLEDRGIDPMEVCAFILGTSIKESRGEAWQWKVASQIIHSKIDVDRLDYMMRDDYMTGASLVSVDINRMVDIYSVIDRELGLSGKGLSTIENFLRGRIQLYMWVSQHHKVIYTNELLREMMGIMKQNLDKNPFTVKNVLEKQLDDNFVLNKVRKMAMDEKDDQLVEYYNRYKERDYHESCWKHVLDFRESVQFKRRKKLKQDIFPERSKELRDGLADQLGIESSEIIVGTSNTPRFTHSDLESIHVEFEDEARPLSEFGVYKTREEFVKPIPYIFVPSGYCGQTISLLNGDEFYEII